MSDEHTPETPAAPPKQVRRGWPRGKKRDPKPAVAATVTVDPLPVPAAPKSTISVTPRRNDALARRLSGNPHATGLKTYPLKEPKRWQLYVGNNYNNDDELYRMVHELGWLPLEASDLACKPEEIGFRVSEDGNLVRGPQGKEMLFKMPIEDYTILQQRKTEANNATIGRPGAAKAAAAGAVAAAFGPEAADFVDKHLVGQVTDTLEPLPS
jgi:hypothetical protein